MGNAYKTLVVALVAIASCFASSDNANAVLVIPADGVLQADGEGLVTSVPSTLSGLLSVGDTNSISFLVQAKAGDTVANPVLGAFPNALSDIRGTFGRIAVTAPLGLASIDYDSPFSNVTFTFQGPFGQEGLPAHLSPVLFSLTFTGVRDLADDRLKSGVIALHDFDLSQGGFEQIHVRLLDSNTQTTSNVITRLDDIQFSEPVAVPEGSSFAYVLLATIFSTFRRGK